MADPAPEIVALPTFPAGEPAGIAQIDSSSVGKSLPRIRAALLAVAVLLYLYNLWDFVVYDESASTQWRWALSIVLVLGSQLPAGFGRLHLQTRGDLPRGLGVFAAGLVVATAFWLRIVDLSQLPLSLHGDMASMGLGARDLLAGRVPHLFSVGWATIPWLGYVPAASSIKLFGDSIFGLGMSAVVAGTFSVFGTYLLCSLLFSRRMGVLAAAISAVGYADIHFSRLAAYMDPVPWMVFGLYFLMRALRFRERFSFVLSGCLLAFGFQMYFSGRVMVFVLAALFAHQFLFGKRLDSEIRWGLALFCLSALVTFGPMLAYFVLHPGEFASRGREVFLFHPAVLEHLKDKYDLSGTFEVVREQMWRTALVFNSGMDSSTQFGFRHPLFNPRLAPMLVLGVAHSLGRWREDRHALILSWLGLVLVLGSFLTNNSPFWPRLVVMLPAAAILAASALDRVAVGLVTGLGRFSRLRPLSLLASLGFVAWIGLQNWEWYTRDMSQHVNAPSWLGRVILESSPETRFCMIRGPRSFEERHIRFIASRYDLVDFESEAMEAHLPQCLAAGAIWVFYQPEHTAELGWIRERWPGGLERRWDTPSGWPGPILWSPPRNATNELAASRGVEVSAPEDLDRAPGTSASVAIYRGSTASRVSVIDAGSIRLHGGDLQVRISAVPGSDCVYDYVEVVAEDGATFRVEAEDREVTSGGLPVESHLEDDHWWLQEYGPFSGSRGLVALKSESPPTLSTRMRLDPGIYKVRVGSFYGDPSNGVFAIGIALAEIDRKDPPEAR